MASWRGAPGRLDELYGHTQHKGMPGAAPRGRSGRHGAAWKKKTPDSGLNTVAVFPNKQLRMVSRTGKFLLR
jgi:hypothetical protein